MTSKISPQEAALAAKTICAFYPAIPASDPKVFAAGLVQTLQQFPREVIERAVDPVRGVPAKLEFLNLAAIRNLLEAWMSEYLEHERWTALRDRKRLPDVAADPAMEARVASGLQQLAAYLKSGLGTSSLW